jgi:hypothetical protein
LSGLVAGIVIGVVVSAIAAYLVTNPSVLANIQMVGAIDMTQPKISKTYADCKSDINGTYRNSDDDRIWTRCNIDNDSANEVQFTFKLPASMDDFYRLDVKSAVYEYSDGSYELGLYDSVGEKRYKLAIWEFPQ